MVEPTQILFRVEGILLADPKSNKPVKHIPILSKDALAIGTHNCKTAAKYLNMFLNYSNEDHGGRE